MKSQFEKLIKKENGQSLVQFAILLPILIVMLSVTVDVWRIVDAKLLLRSTTSQAAFVMSQLPLDKKVNKDNGVNFSNKTEVEDFVKDTAKGKMKDLTLSIEYENEKNIKYDFKPYKEDPNTYNNMISYKDAVVTGTCKVNLVTPFLGKVINVITKGSNIDGDKTIFLESKAVSRVGVPYEKSIEILNKET